MKRVMTSFVVEVDVDDDAAAASVVVPFPFPSSSSSAAAAGIACIGLQGSWLWDEAACRLGLLPTFAGVVEDEVVSKQKKIIFLK